MAKCASCGIALTGALTKSGRYTYYVCNSLLKRGAGACDTPRLNAGEFERLIIDNVRQHILTESNIRDLVRMVDEEMDGAANEQPQRLETIEEERHEVRRRLDPVWKTMESSDLGIDDAAPRLRIHRQRQEQLKAVAEQARMTLAERRQLLDEEETIA